MRFYDPSFKMLQKNQKNLRICKRLHFSLENVALKRVSNSPKNSIFAARLKQNQKIRNMKKLLLILVCALLASCGHTSKAQNEMKDMTEDQKMSYALGVNSGDQFRNLGLNIDIDMFIKGIKDGIANSNQFSQEEMQAAFEYLDKQARANQNKAMNDEKAAGTAFLAKNKNEEGVKETESGLQYKVVKEGTGKKPLATDKVKVHYKGTLLDGTVFDSSYDRGEPITFPLNGVIKGWTEGLQLMSEGSKYILYIPSDLGYGDRGAGGQIKPGATLIFEVELLEVNPAN